MLSLQYHHWFPFCPFLSCTYPVFTLQLSGSSYNLLEAHDASFDCLCIKVSNKDLSLIIWSSNLTLPLSLPIMNTEDKKKYSSWWCTETIANQVGKYWLWFFSIYVVLFFFFKSFVLTGIITTLWKALLSFCVCTVSSQWDTGLIKAHRQSGSMN